MKTLDFLGLGASGAKATVKELQQLLADLQVFYANVHGYHWHIEGHKFFLLHKQFEEIYSEINEQIDEVAERILVLGDYPESKYSNYLKTAKIKEAGLVKDTDGSIQGTLDGFKVIIKQLRKIIEVADKGGDKKTEDLATGYLEAYEKKTWMLVAFMK